MVPLVETRTLLVHYNPDWNHLKPMARFDFANYVRISFPQSLIPTETNPVNGPANTYWFYRSSVPNFGPHYGYL